MTAAWSIKGATRVLGAFLLGLFLPSLLLADVAQDADRARRAGVKTLVVGVTGILLPNLGVYVYKPLAEHGELLSFFAENAQADLVLDQFREQIGGPSYTSLEPLTRPVSMALHSVSLEDVLRRMLDGYNYVLEYRGGRLAHVRVLRMIPGRGYKTPRVAESRSRWLELESAAP